MSFIRGVLLAGKFRSQHELNHMSREDQRNTLIVELAGHSNQSDYQSFDDDTLAGMGAVMVFLRETGIRDDEALRMMSADDQRNTMIVEMGIQNPHLAHLLQSFSNLDLVLLGLGGHAPGSDSIHLPTFIRGVLLAGKFRTQHELNQMSDEDQRNTLIVELTKHSNQSNYQSFDNFALAGMGAVMVFLRETGIRDDDGLSAMSADDQRNTLIVELDAQTRLGSRLQLLRNMDLVRLGLGADPTPMFKALPRPRPSFIRGVLLAAKSRSQHELNHMSNDDQRNTLIVELAGHSNQSNYQSFDDDTLAGMGAVMVFLRETGIRNSEGLRRMSADDQRNTMIVEMGIQNPQLAHLLQGFKNLDLVLLGLGGHAPGSDSIHPPTFIRGVLLAGKFRTQHELNRMSSEDQRNTLIVELTKHSNQSNYQAFDDYTLAGMGAVMVFLRHTGIRDDAALQTMSAEDQRNTLIVELDAQTNLGSRLQLLRNMDLVRVGLGADPAPMFKALPPPLEPPPPMPSLHLQFRLRDFIQFRSTDDFLQGARDEVFISAIGLDSSQTYQSAHGPTTDKIESPVIGDITDDSVRGPWKENPHVLLEWDLDRVGPTEQIRFGVDGPMVHRVFTVILLVVEEDNESLGETFDEFKGRIRDKINEAITSAGASALKSSTDSAGLGALVGGAVGGIPGAVASFFVTLALDELFSAISEGLANEVFTPKYLRYTLEHPIRALHLVPEDFATWFEIKEKGALYRIVYDWHIKIGE